jgi:hypothetical protein
MNYLFLFFFASGLIAQTMSFNKETGQVIPKHIGEVKFIIGNVLKKSFTDNEVPISIGTKFFKNETIITEDKSFAKIQMIDETMINLGANSSLKFEKFDYQSKNERKSLYHIIRGELSGDVKNKAKSDEDVVFKTKNATLAVRGTKLHVHHLEKNNIEVSQFGLERGLALVEAKFEKKVIELTPQKKVIVAKNGVTNKSIIEEKTFNDEDHEVLKNIDGFLPLSNFDFYLTQLDSSAQNSQLGNSQIEGQKKMEEDQTGSFENLRRLNEKLRKNKKSW